MSENYALRTPPSALYGIPPSPLGDAPPIDFCVWRRFRLSVNDRVLPSMTAASTSSPVRRQAVHKNAPRLRCLHQLRRHTVMERRFPPTLVSASNPIDARHRVDACAPAKIEGIMKHIYLCPVTRAARRARRSTSASGLPHGRTDRDLAPPWRGRRSANGTDFEVATTQLEASQVGRLFAKREVSVAWQG